VRVLVGILYSLLGIISIVVSINFRGVTATLASRLSKQQADWGLTPEALRWYAAEVTLVCAAVAGLGLNFPPLTLVALAAFVPTILVAWTLGFVRRAQGRRLFTFPGRWPEIVSWAFVLMLLIGGMALAKPVN
jgi:hypothetical protein